MGIQDLRNKKASIFDLVYIMVFIFIAALSIIIAYTIYDKYITATADVEAFDNPRFGNVTSMSKATLLNFDYLFIFIVFGLLILTIVAGFSVESHPAFFFISLFLLIIVIVMGASFANVWDEITNSSALSAADVETNYPITDYFMNHFPTMLLVLGIVLIIVFYAKSKLGGEY